MPVGQSVNVKKSDGSEGSTLLENRHISDAELFREALECVRKHKLGVDYLTRIAKAHFHVETFQSAWSSVAESVRTIVDLSRRPVPADEIEQATNEKRKTR